MNIAPDKWKHFYVGIVLGVVLQFCAIFLLPLSLIWSAIIVLFVVAAISYGFELFSLFTGLGHYDVIDAVAGVIGGIIGQAVAVAVKYWLM